MKSYLTKNSISALVALLTFFGIALHDTKLDSMATLAIAIPVAAMGFEAAHMVAAGDAHTHVERVSVDRLAGRFTSQLPKIRMGSGDRDYRQGKRNGSGRNAFDDMLYPIPS